jgi:hypothetical protein
MKWLEIRRTWRPDGRENYYPANYTLAVKGGKGRHPVEILLKPCSFAKIKGVFLIYKGNCSFKEIIYVLYFLK